MKIKTIMEMDELEQFMQALKDAKNAKEWEAKYYKVVDKLNALADEVINDEMEHAKEDAKSWKEYGLSI